MKHELPTLPYEYNALEPYIDEQTMKIHHTKHHQAYINKYVAALENSPEWLEKPVEKVLQELEKLPEDSRKAVRNNGGGYYNHMLFWEILGPNSKPRPEGKLAAAINAKFGSFDNFKEMFNNAAATRFGSGWAWLVVDKQGNVSVTSTPNQDVPFEEGTPILGLDVWEHAYYLKYQNRRPDYIEAFWNVVNWDKVEENYHNA